MLHSNRYLNLKHSLKLALSAIFFMTAIGFYPISEPRALSSFPDTAIDWALFNTPTGYTIPYTFQGQPISDEEGSSDSTNGGAAVRPASIDLSSGSPNDHDPGPFDTPSYGYYNGGTEWDPNDPATLEDDHIRFTMRLNGDPRKKDGFANYHWNVLIDVDGDGYKEFWADLFGNFSANGYDQLQILYDNDNDQEVEDPDVSRVAEYRAYNYEDAGAPGGLNYSHTRVRAAGDGTTDYFIDIQVPMTAFNDLLGNQILFPNSPVGFVFSTSASVTDPLQKDFMTDLGFLTTNDPINFGDLIKSNGEPDLYFSDFNLNELDFYTVSDDIYLYMRDVFANSHAGAIDTVTVTVTDPLTGDDETVTLTESGPATGIFSNLGGADRPASSDPANAWIPYVETSQITESEMWTLVYSEAAGDWTVTGSLSGIQTGKATTGMAYSSDHGSITFTVYDTTPAEGDSIMFQTYAGDPLLSSPNPGADDDGDLQTSGGHHISYAYTNIKSNTYTDTASIVGPGDPFLQFTRADGSPSYNFELTPDSKTSDRLHVTVYHMDSNTDPGNEETITVNLYGIDSDDLATNSGSSIVTSAGSTFLTDGVQVGDPFTILTGPDAGVYLVAGVDSETQITLNQPLTGSRTGISFNLQTDSDTLTLTETGGDTGIFRNTTGFATKVSDGTVLRNDNLWEDIDQGRVSAVFSVNGENFSDTAVLFYIEDAGRVFFTNGAVTLGIEQYAAEQPIFIRVSDESYTCGGSLTVTVASASGDSETIELYETFPGSFVYMNRINDLATTAGSAIVTSASSAFLTAGVQPGQTFAIATGPDTGTYTVASADSETQLTLGEVSSATRTELGFNAFPVMTATYDGAFTLNDGVLEAAHNDTMTVFYTDCTDGDSNPTNDIKQDLGAYNAPPIVINEVFFYPDIRSDSPTGDRPQYEYVEIYNTSSIAMDVSGYSVTDGDEFSYTLPPDNGGPLLLQPGQKLYVVLVPAPGAAGIPDPGINPIDGAWYVYAVVSMETDQLGDAELKGVNDLFTRLDMDDPANYTADQVVSLSSTFVADGVQVGDPFIMVDGNDAGSYTVASVDSNTQITLNTGLGTEGGGFTFITGDIGMDLETSAGSGVVTSASSTFITEGIEPGDTLVIATGNDAGIHRVKSVESETRLTLTRVMTQSATGIRFDFAGYSGDPADQLLLYDAANSLVDYMAWSSTASNTADFKNDDQPAISTNIWTDNSFKGVADAENDFESPISAGESLVRSSDGLDTDTPEDWVYSTPSIDMGYVLTLAMVSSFRIYTTGNTVVAEWITASEVGTVGFYLYRKDPGSNQYVRVNESILPGLITSPLGGVYRFMDSAALPGETYTYILEEIESNGTRRNHGPFTVNSNDEIPPEAQPSMTGGYARVPN